MSMAGHSGRVGQYRQSRGCWGGARGIGGVGGGFVPLGGPGRERPSLLVAATAGIYNVAGFDAAAAARTCAGEAGSRRKPDGRPGIRTAQGSAAPACSEPAALTVKAAHGPA